jgi:hypothetical protein
MSISKGQSSCRETNPDLASSEEYNDHASSEQQNTKSGKRTCESFYTPKNETPMESAEAPWAKRLEMPSFPI